MKNIALSRRYASALFSELKTTPAKKKVVDQFKEIIELTKTSKEFANLIVNPIVADADKVGVFISLFRKKRFDKMLLSFILILIENNRLDLIESICVVLEEMLMDVTGQIKVEVVFASKPAPAVKTAVSKKIAAITKRKVVMTEVIDPSIISGVVVRYGSTLIDASVQGSIDSFIEEYA